MKTTYKQFLMMLGLGALMAASQILAGADEAVAAKAKEKTFSGTIMAVDEKERALKVKRFLATKSFHLGDNCQISVGDRKITGMGDLRRGQKVEVRYKEASGVLVAGGVAQQPMVWNGRIESIDAEHHSLVVKNGKTTKTFTIADESKVMLAGDKTGKFDDVKIGHKVAVIYELPGDKPVARRIEQKSETFTGSLTAINATERTVRAKHLIGEKKFRLANDCRILVNGTPDATLSDLRLGQKFTFSYEEVDGIRIVNRIAGSEEQAAAETADATK